MRFSIYQNKTTLGYFLVDWSKKRRTFSCDTIRECLDLKIDFSCYDHNKLIHNGHNETISFDCVSSFIEEYPEFLL